MDHHMRVFICGKHADVDVFFDEMSWLHTEYEIDHISSNLPMRKLAERFCGYTQIKYSQVADADISNLTPRIVISFDGKSAKSRVER